MKGLKGCETVEVDYHKPESVAKALQGIEKVFLVTPPGQSYIGHQLVPAFVAAGVKHVVKLSALGTEEKDPTAFAWAFEHRGVEDAIKKAGISLTSLRPSSFYSNIFGDAATVKGQSTLYRATGTAKLNWISNEDVGEVGAVALTTPGHEGKEYYLTGPHTLSAEEFGKLWSDVLGKQINVVLIDDAQLRESVKAWIPNEEGINGFSNMFIYFKNGGYNREFGDLEKVLGRKAQPIRPYLEATKQAFL